MSSCSCNDMVGYRFHPTDKELIDHYVWNKALDRDYAVQAIGEVVGDLCNWEPGELSIRRSNDPVWYIFYRRKHSKRVKRTTKLGYCKLTGKHRPTWELAPRRLWFLRENGLLGSYILTKILPISMLMSYWHNWERQIAQMRLKMKLTTNLRGAGAFL